MTFTISLNMDFQYDEENDKYFLNGVELDPIDVNRLKAYDVKPEFTHEKNNHDITFAIDPKFMTFLREKYYKN
jgi:hypothetical protein